MLAMCTIAGCSGNELNGSNEPEVYPGHPEDAVYMNVNIQLPVGGKNTRSSTDSDSDDDYGTSTDGTEVGKDYENKVNGVLIVLADANNNFIAAGEHNSLPVVREGIVNTTQKINKSALAAYYGSGTLGTGKDQVNLYVFCNPTMELKKSSKSPVPTANGLTRLPLLKKSLTDLSKEQLFGEETTTRQAS